MKNYFVDAVLFGDLSNGGTARVTVRDGEIAISAVEGAPADDEGRPGRRDPGEDGADGSTKQAAADPVEPVEG